MLFKPELCEAILRGDKTQTRRLARGWRDWWGYDERGRINCVRLGGNSRVAWQIGHTYAIQPGRGKKAIGRIRITGIQRRQLQAITPLDILAEGIDNGKTYYGPRPGDYIVKSPVQLREEFADLWDSINTKKGTCWADNPKVWVLEFTNVEKEGRND